MSALSLSPLTKVSLQNTHGCITKSFQCRWAMLTFHHGDVEAHDRTIDPSITIWVFDGCPITNVCFFHMLAAGKSEVLSASLSGRDCVLLNGSCRCGVPDSSILNYLL